MLFLYAQGSKLDSKSTGTFLSVFGIFFAVFTLCYLGFRPINGIFVDMTMYAHMFSMFQDGEMNLSDMSGDRGFYFFIQFCASIMDAPMFFFSCAAVYIVPLVVATMKWFKKIWFYALVMLIASFSFWGYGVNGIRNGMATSLFIFAVSFYERRIIMILLLMLAISFHKSMALPTLGLALTFVNNDTRKYIRLWLISIPLSLVLGNAFITIFTALGFDDERVGVYLTDNLTEDTGGFHWNFVIYSALGVVAGWYYIVKRNYEDVFYKRLVNIYIFANAFWVLIIRAGFSNRFAYLSWFLLGIIIIYPLLKVKMFSRQHQIITTIIIVYYMFTYLLNVILIS